MKAGSAHAEKAEKCLKVGGECGSWANGKTDLPMCVIVTGVANIPAKSALYIFIKPESAGAFYPQSSRAGFGPVGRGFKGNWRERVYLGTKELGIGDNYEIIAVVVDETTATDISRTMTAWSAAKDFPGMAELPGSEKARITVTRAQ